MKIEIIVTIQYEVNKQFYNKNAVPIQMLDIDLQNAVNDPADFINTSKKYYNSTCIVKGKLIKERNK